MKFILFGTEFVTNSWNAYLPVYIIAYLEKKLIENRSVVLLLTILLFCTLFYKFLKDINLIGLDYKIVLTYGPCNKTHYQDYSVDYVTLPFQILELNWLDMQLWL